jgi:hypothetical protein
MKLLKEISHYILYMKAQRDFVILMMHQIEKLSIVQIYQYFEYTISIDYITDIVTNADNDEKYFDKILMDYLVC